MKYYKKLKCYDFFAIIAFILNMFKFFNIQNKCYTNIKLQIIVKNKLTTILTIWWYKFKEIFNEKNQSELTNSLQVIGDF